MNYSEHKKIYKAKMIDSILYAKIFGLYMLIMGILLLSNPEHFKKIIQQLKTNSDMLIWAGTFTLLLGIFMVVTHNVWVLNWQVLITLIGWLTLIKGICLITCPKAIISHSKRIYQGQSFYFCSLGIVLIGVILTTAGFTHFKLCMV